MSGDLKVGTERAHCWKKVSLITTLIIKKRHQKCMAHDFFTVIGQLVMVSVFRKY